jgi:hypothetical protein
LDCVPHPGQEVGCRLSTVTVQACSPRWTLTTFRLGVGDHDADVFITLAAAYRRKMPGVIGRAVSGACTKSESDPWMLRLSWTRTMIWAAEKWISAKSFKM